MDELKFKVSAELKNILGRDLITSDNIAILELVKNSYDAHATKVEITFDDDKIIIADNGKGMTLDELKDKWLFVGYSAKRDGTEDNSYRSKFKRVYAGAKGIGRISCDRLARFVTLTTKSEESDTVETLMVDWQSFEQKQKVEFDTVAVKHSSSREKCDFPLESHHGTILSFTALHGFWGKDEILELRKSLEKMINPFSEANEYKIEIFAPAFNAQDREIKNKIEELLANGNELTDERRAYIAKLKNTIVSGIIENTINDVLKIKTTQIESTLKNGIIQTRLSDRGEIMYEIEEPNRFPLLEDVSINLYYLNRAAKYNFSMRMGVTPVNYGNVFLFRNNFRVWPYGEVNDDSWGLNQRAQQGYNRTLGTRDLFGRVDVETSKIEDFKEVSSRDGGLIMTKPAQELMEFFKKIHKRLERYVVGVLWGEGFVRNNYFQNVDLAQKAREKLQQQDKDLDNTNSIFENIGSKVDFLQLIKSLVNDDTIIVKYYNAKLADIVSDVSATDIIQANIFHDIRKVAEKTNDTELASNIELFEEQINQMRKEKEDAERKAEEARKKAEEEEYKRKAEEEKRREKEKELEAQKQKNLYLTATRNTTQEIQDITHAISIASTEQLSILSNISSAIRAKAKIEDILPLIHELGFFANKVKQLSMLITKADIVSLKTKVRVDLKQYIEEYLANFKDSLKINIHGDINEPIWKRLSLLDIAIVLDNLISNSKKNNATTLIVNFLKTDDSFEVVISDDGDGVDLATFTKDSLFDEGVTNKKGGSGIGLHTIRYTMEQRLNGTVEFLGNNLYNAKGASFKLTFK
ncbi:ATP-binding protein [Alistipes sp.]|uniref:ATP-binding protein n=1 Tax=Alistipes sp. TaxID=1872444 RepID=UPI00307802DD